MQKTKRQTSKKQKKQKQNLLKKQAKQVKHYYAYQICTINTAIID